MILNIDIRRLLTEKATMEVFRSHSVQFLASGALGHTFMTSDNPNSYHQETRENKND